MGGLKTVLITGANGFLGSHLTEILIKKHLNVVIICRSHSNFWRIDNLSGYKRYKVDSSNFDYNLIFEENKIDAIVHLATDYGRNSTFSDVLQSNVILPLKLLEFGIKNGLKIFINTDTFIAKKESAYKYLNEYAQSKLIFKDILKLYSRDISIANMKLEHVYGEKDADTKFVTNIIRDLLLNKTEIELTAGTQKRDFVYVKDVVDAFIIILSNAESITGYQEFEVGTGVTFSIREFVEKSKEISHSLSKLNFGILPMREGEFIESKADVTKLLNLGWKVNYSLVQGLTNTINYEKNKLSN